MKSIMWGEKACFFCGSTSELQTHHCIHGTANRKLADKYGLTVILCRRHHEAVHQDEGMDIALKMEAQRAWEKQYGSRNDFMRVFGRSYL